MGRMQPSSGTGSTFRLRDVALVGYGPTIVNATGHGAVMPVLALRARELGADVSTAALVVALLGIGQLLGSLPAGALIARIGERRTLLYGGLVDAVVMVAAALSGSVLVLGVATVLSGFTWTAFLLARQGFMIDAVPLSHRARALSGLGGAHRVGIFLGPLLGAALIHVTSLRSVFVLAAVMSVASALMARLMPDLGSENRQEASSVGHLSVWSVLAAHRRTLLTLGVAIVVIGASRSVRNGLLPLWADHVGLAASTTSLIFAIAAAIDIAFFFPGGWLMDTRGRTVVAVPVVATVAVAALLLPLTHEAWSVTLVVALIALGNGLGSGIVMTLGADAAPAQGRSQFLGGWRLCGDLGNTAGPLLVGAVALVAPLATASVAIGLLMAAGTAWVGYWVRRADRERSVSGR
ncbi:Predicted arabinose efflux permease, MFS family [Nocardioides lianchengensis]|uniref:Predicted arabinose efflux permease, MFS family n=2 Tax=Nocardioides lianchengensis TaxID=1045774 RepID=A0A1G6Y4J6_9ACTN|nr:Predicted arabinose efflux permease, MFS family [Nocardioides lianchengensis]